MASLSPCINFPMNYSHSFPGIKFFHLLIREERPQLTFMQIMSRRCKIPQFHETRQVFFIYMSYKDSG
jgi:hypothetical protein